MNQIPDYLRKNLKIVFVGFNPSIRSGETGHHFANPNNRFWKILFNAGLTPRLYKPEEDYKLLDIGFGMTNIVARPTKAADEITKEEYQTGREILKQKITDYKPKIVCYVGKGVYQEYGKKKDVSWGEQPESVIQGTIDFVAPSSSGLVRMKLEEIIEIYRHLAVLEAKLNKAAGR